MDFSKRFLSNPNLGVPDPNPSDLHTRPCFQKEDLNETDENARPFHKGFAARSPDPKKEPPSKNFISATITSASKKILAERNHEAASSDPSDTLFDATPHLDTPSHITPFASRVRVSGDRKAIVSGSPHHAPYDPVTNYLSPRPQFLRYNPNRRQEFLLRMEGAMRNEEGSGVEESSSVSSTSSQLTAQEEAIQESMGDGSEGGGMEEDAEEERPRCLTMVCKLLLLFGILVSSTCYISSTNPSSVPFLREYGVFLENHLMVQDWIPQRAGNLSIFSGDILESLAGSPGTCLSVHLRESPSQDEGINSNLLVSDDLIKREEFKGQESLDEISDSHPRDSTTGNEGSSTDMLIPGEFAERVDDSEVEKSHDGIELVTGDEENLLVNGSLSGNGLVAEQKSEEAVDSHEFIVEEQYGGRNTRIVADVGIGEEEIENPETVEAGDIVLADDSLQALQAQFGTVNSPTFQDEQSDLLGSLETQTSSREETQRTGSEEVTVSSQVPQSQIVLNAPSDDGITEMSEFSTVSDSEMKWGPSRRWICSLAAILGFLSALYKYFSKSHQNPHKYFSRSPSCSEPAVEEKTTRTVLVNEEIENKGSESMPSNHSSDEHKELYAFRPSSTMELVLERRGAEDLRSSVPLNHSSDEHEELYASRPPTVELLREFSVADTNVSETGSGWKLKREGAEELQFSQSERRRLMRKNLSSSANKVYSSSSPESVSNGSFTAQEKPLRKEDIGNIGEMKVVTTPLRRSSRLRSRVTSP